MTNTNCLEGICCPKCGQDTRFKIAAGVTCIVTDDGSEAVGDHDWGYESHTQCPACGHEGPLSDFRKLPPDPDRSDKGMAFRTAAENAQPVEAPKKGRKAKQAA